MSSYDLKTNTEVNRHVTRRHLASKTHTKWRHTNLSGASNTEGGRRPTEYLTGATPPTSGFPPNQFGRFNLYSLYEPVTGSISLTG